MTIGKRFIVLLFAIWTQKAILSMSKKNTSHISCVQKLDITCRLYKVGIQMCVGDISEMRGKKPYKYE